MAQANQISSHNQTAALEKFDHKSHYGKVAILPTSPKAVIEDYARLLDIINYQQIFDHNHDIILKINLSWTKFFPACSTPPWALDGVIRKLKSDKYSRIIPLENHTVVTDPFKGAKFNKWTNTFDRENLEYVALPNVKWVPFKPKHDMMAMDELFNPILIPECFLNSYVIHLPTVKVHGHTVTTGAMKNAFGGLIPKYRHHSHKVIHEVLVDLLAIQQEIHPKTLAVMDGTVCGNGAGPRTMIPYIGNLILASFDQVAIDALSAKIMGFDPLKIPYIKMAHDLGLGIGDVDQIDIVGMDSSEVKSLNFNFKSKRSLVIEWDQRLRITTANVKWLHWLHRFLFYSGFFRLFIFGSEAYHDYFWYPAIGKHRINKFLRADHGWGKLFQSYPLGKPRKYPEIREWDPY